MTIDRNVQKLHLRMITPDIQTEFPLQLPATNNYIKAYIDNTRLLKNISKVLSSVKILASENFGTEIVKKLTRSKKWKLHSSKINGCIIIISIRVSIDSLSSRKSFPIVNLGILMLATVYTKPISSKKRLHFFHQCLSRHFSTSKRLQRLQILRSLPLNGKLICDKC